MSDSPITGRSFRVFNVMDDFDREALRMKVNFSMPGIRVVEYLRETIEVYGKPLAIRVDNGPVFLTRIFVNYCEEEDIEIKYIQPGKPSQNGFIERFREEYNCFHPHKSLGRSSPKEYLEDFSKGHAPLKDHFV